MNFTVLNWNVGGAKVLELKHRDEREKKRKDINEALKYLLLDQGATREPDVVTLQEIVQWQEPGDSNINDLVDSIDGYDYLPFRLIDTRTVSSKAKWRKVRCESDWKDNTYFMQGNAFLIKKSAPHFPLWDLSKPNLPKPEGDHFIEKVHLDTGLYFGDRNTEPRAALVAHFIYPYEGKPLDIFVVNLHLTTLTMEREGVPEIDVQAKNMRIAQLRVVFNGIVSRYNAWRQSGYRQRGEKRAPLDDEIFDRYSPVWIITGDFNFTEESDEYEFIKKMNFIDTVLENRKITGFGHGSKAKGAGKPPTLTLDYIFAGPKFISFDPAIKDNLGGNEVIHVEKIRVSDHYPVWSQLELLPQN